VTAPSYNSDGQYTAPIVLFGFLIGMQCCEWLDNASHAIFSDALIGMTITSAIEAGVSTMYVKVQLRTLFFLLIFL